MSVTRPPRTSVYQWAALSAVVELGSYAKAAAALHRSQPAVSYAIANLQESLGVKLLVIQGRRAVLTAQGDTLLKRARSVLSGLQTVEQLAQVLKKGWESQLRLVVDAAFPRARLLEIVRAHGVAAPAPILFGYLATLMSFRSAAMLMASVYVIGMVALLWAPETKGQPLPED